MKIINNFIINKHLKRIKKHSDVSNVCLHELPTIRHAGFHCVELSAKFRGINYKSWGTDNSIQKATIKAIYEFYERIARNSYTSMIFKNNKGSEIVAYNYEYGLGSIVNFTSNGTAAHYNAKKAKQYALYEAIERHVILKSIAEQIIPQKVSEELFLKENHEYKVFQYLYQTTDNMFVALTKLVANEKFTYAFSANKNLKFALQKSKKECLSNIHFLIHNKIDRNLSKDSIGPERIHLENTKGCKDLEKLLVLSTKSSSGIIKIDLSDENVFYHEYKLPNELKSRNIHIYSVVSPMLQPLFFTTWDKAQINMNAIIKSNKLRGFHCIA